MKQLSLKFKLIIGGLLAVLIPLFIIGFFSVNKASNALLEAGKSQAKQVAQDLSTMTELYLEQEMKFAKTMSVEPLVINAAMKIHENGLENAMPEVEALEHLFATSIKQTGNSYEIFILTDANGITIADSMGGALRAKKLSVADRPYFLKAKAGQANIGAPVKSRATGNAVVAVAIPLKTASGEFAGIFGTILKLDTLSDKLTQVKIGKTGYPFMIDRTGLTVAHPNKEFILELNLGTLKGMESITTQMMALKSGVDEYHFKGIDKVAGFAPVPAAGWSIGVTQNKDEFMETAVAIRNLILIVGIIFLVITALGILWFARSITLPINRISNGLNQGAEQVAAASNEVSTASQSLAEGSSQQAASIEETSSSMEEMSSMTKNNAENAKHADNLMKDANKVVIQANESMGQLTLSMKEISRASEETSKIIKTIDEIAFQTNLLALNAAVEAARAGEAGAGFAVVADEVRNLAMRAADAAKNTADLIEGTVKKVNEGSELVASTNDAFIQVAESSGKVGELVAEIAQASNEQSDGINQVNIAISEMDKVVQQNAANAEESASASEEMNAQAEQLKEYVGDLVMVITGSKESTSMGTTKKNVNQMASNHHVSPVRERKMLQSGSNEVRPDQVIPFDEDGDFKDF
jgi:methyl-accepting chemotaxis protein